MFREKDFDGGDAFPGVAYEAALAQFVTGAGALWASTVSARAAAALWTSTVSARLMKSTASAGVPASCGVESVRLWPGASTATTRTGHGVLVFFREGGDDTKAVALDSVVGDTGHVAEIDDLALEGL